MTPREWTLLLSLSLLWGGSFFFIEIALEGFPPLTIVLGRIVVAALLLLTLVRLKGLRMPGSARVWGALAVMGLMNNALPFTLIVWAQQTVTGGLAAILNATTPLFTVVVAHLATADERLTPAKIAGVVLGLGGVAYMVGPEAVHDLGRNVVAQLAVLAAAASYACSGVWGRRFRGLAPMVTAAGQVTCSSVMLAPIALAVDRPWTLAAPGAGAWLALGALAVASTAVAYLIYFRLLATAGATNLLLVTFLIPVSAIALGGLFLGETIGIREVTGMIGIALGLAAVDGRVLRLLRPRPA